MNAIKPLPVDRHTDGPRRGRVLTGRAQKAPETAGLVPECNADDEKAPMVAWRRSVVSGTDENTFDTGPDLLVVPEDVVGDLEDAEGGNSGCQPREAHERKPDEQRVETSRLPLR